MKFSALKKNFGRLAAGAAAAFTLAAGMVMPASAMSTTAATQATQLHQSSQASPVTELGLTSSAVSGESEWWPWWYYPYYGGGGYYNNTTNNNQDNSIHQCSQGGFGNHNNC